MFDTGGIRTVQFKPGGGTVTEGIMTATQAAACRSSRRPATSRRTSPTSCCRTTTPITRPTPTTFAGATWIVQKAERDFMFADKPQGIIQPAQYSALKNAKTKVLNNEDFDVFGDGTRGDQVDARAHAGPPGAVREAPEAGPVVLAGDLYHYPEERATGRTPTFEFNAEQSAASREEDRGVHQAEQSRALDRARHRDAREAAEGAGVR